MEVKVQCSCGQKYRFDVEPVNGRLPAPVHCPVCGMEGTEAANSVIQVALAAAPPPVETSRIRLNLPGRSEAGGSPPAFTPEPTIAPAPLSPAPSAAGPRPYPPSEPSLFLGIVGAVAAGIVGVIAWYFLCKATGMKLRYAAIGVGWLTGSGARLLCRKPGVGLGVSAAAVAFVVILVGQILMAKSRMDKFVDTLASEGYEERVKYAKEAIQAIPTGSDQEIRAFLATDNAEEGEKPDPSQVSAEDIKEFREKQLPELRDLASGKISKEKFRRDLTKLESEDGGASDMQETGIYKIVLVVMSFGLLGIVWLIIGVGSAYKVAAGVSGTLRHS